MNDRPTNEDRQALVVGDRAGALDPSEAADVALLADLLGDPSTWAEPSPGLEDAVVQAVEDAPPSQTHRDARPRRWRIVMSAVAAAAAVAIIFGAVIVARRSASTDFHARLDATAAAPGARASADIIRNNAGFRVVLDAHGLPALPAGQYYQAWLKNATGTLVPIGTFSSSDGRITLWSGVSPKQFPTMSVTIESTDGVQATSGRRVLVGQVHQG